MSFTCWEGNFISKIIATVWGSDRMRMQNMTVQMDTGCKIHMVMTGI